MSNEVIRRLEERVARLEDELRQLKDRSAKEQAQEPWWQKSAGMFEGDKAFAEIVRLGRQIRRAGRNSLSNSHQGARGKRRRKADPQE